MKPELWAITTYFNYYGCPRRRGNYATFLRNLGVPLLTVEYGVAGAFELSSQDADLYVRVEGTERFWAKEALVNAAVDHLPPSCRHVVLLDCDIVFLDPEWHLECDRMLDRHPVFQPFARVHHLDPADSGAPHRVPAGSASFEVSLCSAVRSRGRPEAQLEVRAVRGDGSIVNGMAWAMRREVLSDAGLYDGSILGGGDTALAAAVAGFPERCVELHGMNDRQADYYRRWSARFAPHVPTEIAGLDTDLLHLWHGPLEGRFSRDRHAVLASSGFDPSRHLRPRAGRLRLPDLSDLKGLTDDMDAFFARRATALTA